MTDTGTGYIIYGRLKSVRFPRKGLVRICAKPLLRIMADRVLLSRGIARVVLATSELPEDTPLAELAAAEGLGVYRGYPEDVISRLTETARLFGFDRFLTSTVDAPFQLKETIDAVISELTDRGADMVTTYPGQPNGTDCFGVRTAAAERVVALKRMDQTECWPPYFTGTGLFRTGKVNLFADYPHLADFRLTIDYPEDLVFCEKLYADLTGRFGAAFTCAQLIEVLQSAAYQSAAAPMRQQQVRWQEYFDRHVISVGPDVERIRSESCADDRGDGA